MLSVVFAASLLLPFAEDVIPAHGTDGELELVSIVGSTHLELVNPTSHAALVRIADAESHGLATIVVPARGEVSLEFPRHTLAGTTMALFAVGPEGARITSGALAIDDIVDGGFRAVWFESQGEAVSVFGELATGAGLIEPTGAAPAKSAPKPIKPGPHVPVINPVNKPRGDLPPKIEPKPLPPV